MIIIELLISRVCHQRITSLQPRPIKATQLCEFVCYFDMLWCWIRASDWLPLAVTCSERRSYSPAVRQSFTFLYICPGIRLFHEPVGIFHFFHFHTKILYLAIFLICIGNEKLSYYANRELPWNSYTWKLFTRWRTF